MKKRFLLFSLICIASVLLTVFSEAGPLDTWYSRIPNPSVDTELYSIAYGNNSFVAVGYSGGVVTSADGATWTKQAFPNYDTLYEVAYGNETFVAVGKPMGGFDGKIYTSASGITWTDRSSGISSQLAGSSLNGVTYGSIFVAVGNHGKIFSSPDGITWTERSSIIIQDDLLDVAFGNNTFAAVGRNGRILTSPNGTEWTPVTVASIGTHYIDAVEYVNGLFYIVIYDNGTPVLYTSPDGTEWTQGGSTGFDSMTFSNGMYAAVNGALTTSTDGLIWSAGITGSTNDFYGITYAAGMFVAVGERGAITTSSDGVEWIARNTEVTEIFSGVAYGNDTFVAVGGGLVTKVFTSSDGITWVARDPEYYPRLYGITFGNNMFVAVGGGGKILSSPDGVHWTKISSSGTTNSLSDIAYMNGTFIAIGSGTIVTSPDGISWTQQTSGTSNNLEGVTYGNALYVAVGDGNTVLTSPNGSEWTPRAPWANQTLNGVAYGNGIFVAVGRSDGILTSPNGIDWTLNASTLTSSLQGIIFADNTFVAVKPGSSTCVLTSPNGIDWTSRIAGTTYYHNTRVTNGYGTFLIVGDNGDILQSESVLFVDVPLSFWAYPYIYAIYSAGITTGYADGTYRPAQNVSRGQMAAFIIRAKFGEDFSYSSTQHFSDIPDTHWVFKYVQKMYDEGITTGYADGTYRPSENVNRAQMATFIIRALFGDTFSYTIDAHFSDVPDTHWAFKYVQKMYDEGITTGYADGTYRPSQNVSRAQMATFIGRAFLGMD